MSDSGKSHSDAESVHLDFEDAQFKALLDAAVEIVIGWYRDLRDFPVFSSKDVEQVRLLFDEDCPEVPSDPFRILSSVAADVFPHSTLNIQPNYYGYITGGGNQVGVIAEFLRAALNQNNLKWHSAPSNTEIERTVLRWIAGFIGYPETAAGVLVSGGSVANFLALAVARKSRSPLDVSREGLFGSPRLTVYVSNQGHSSIDKAVDMLGIGKNNLRKIETDSRFRIRIDLLQEQIRQDLADGMVPVCLIGNAGTTNTGSIDPLDDLAEIARKNDMWFHVDAAYGGPAAGLPEYRNQFAGLEMGDSLVVNPHKWFFIPFEAACVFTRDPDALKSTFSLIPDYLQTRGSFDGRDDLMESNLQLTKDFKALKIWMTFKVYGAEKLRQAIRNDIMLARKFATVIDEDPRYERTASVDLSIVCFRYTGTEKNTGKIDRVNEILPSELERDGRVFFSGTRLDGRPTLRVCFLNHRRTEADIEFLVRVVSEVGESLFESLP